MWPRGMFSSNVCTRVQTKVMKEKQKISNSTKLICETFFFSLWETDLWIPNINWIKCGSWFLVKIYSRRLADLKKMHANRTTSSFFFMVRIFVASGCLLENKLDGHLERNEGLSYNIFDMSLNACLVKSSVIKNILPKINDQAQQ